MRLAGLSLLVVGLAVATFQAAPAPQDPRLSGPHHLDRPFVFTPPSSRAEWLARRAAVRQQVLVAVGLWPMPARAPLAPVVHGRIVRDGYTIEHVAFASHPGHYVTGNLYRPVGEGRKPVVLAAHGHWENGRMLARPDAAVQARLTEGAERTPEAARHPHQARSAGLARLGFIVFQYDMVGYGDSTALVHREGFADADALLRLQSNMGLQTWNSLRALDFVTSLPDADPTRVGMTGESGGGTQTLILAAIDDRVTAAFPSVMVSGAMQGGCVCENAPLLRVGTSNIELAAVFAPKPMAMSSANDWTKDLLTFGLPELKTVYGLLDAAALVSARYMPFEHGDHLPSRELMYSWFSTHVAGREAAPIVEQPFTPVPPSELSVYDAAHPTPADGLDAVALRRYLTKTSDEQMRGLLDEPGRYREVVTGALATIVNDPFAPRIEVLEASTEPGDPVVQRALVARPSGERVPVTTLTPRGWDRGPVVLWAHPAGGASLFASGVTPVAAVKRLLDRGARVIAPDVFLTGRARGPGDADRLRPVNNEDRFPAYNYGYNRAVLAERVRDLLAALTFAASDRPRDIRLLAVGNAGVWALVARALAGDAVARASIDLNGFDFSGVRDPFDPMMLPGALKYGGVGGMLPLLAFGPTEIYRVPPTATMSEAGRRRPGTVMIRRGSPEARRMADWVLGS